jgi:hypothetical protein
MKIQQRAPFLITLAWGNPYTEPPDGRPRYLAARVVPATSGGGAPQIPEDMRRLHTIGDGYSFYFDRLDLKPPRRLSLKSKQSIRRKRLAARIKKKFPLFAEQMIAEAMRQRPDYYGLETT